ncbi:BAG domain-containing protein Samui [Trichoplax sp. H2]|nr:BAG domain-containing protein Samui [Trichoplax sp. H2]|eukprot:RDD40779.1 BAG domain-containing protein Samui [Trichoplax sp. H2]
MLRFSHPWFDSVMPLNRGFAGRYVNQPQRRGYINPLMDDYHDEEMEYGPRGYQTSEPEQSFLAFSPFENRWPMYSSHSPESRYCSEFPNRSTSNNSIPRQRRRPTTKSRNTSHRTSSPRSSAADHKRDTIESRFDPFGIFPWFSNRYDEKSDNMQEDSDPKLEENETYGACEKNLANINEQPLKNAASVSSDEDISSGSDDDQAMENEVNKDAMVEQHRSLNTESTQQNSSSLPNNDQVITSLTSEEGYEADKSSSCSDEDGIHKSDVPHNCQSSMVKESNDVSSDENHEEGEDQSKTTDEEMTTEIVDSNDTSSDKESAEYCTMQLEKVKSLEDTVQELALKVETFYGSKKDKEYLYIDESLTRVLLELDQVETRGIQQIRDARKLVATFVNNIIDELEFRVNSHKNDSS